ncbi:uncharacterized protein LOC141910950 [Tubulanus polymorphus]|uniref:uncharacterized protein LOC141910950 n=1 Tax=Tubulanus polymorphus TaxID=672921 RepID=UPI003DA3BC80
METDWNELDTEAGMYTGRQTADAQWKRTVTEINELVEQHQTDQQSHKWKGITKSHWVPTSSSAYCQNRRCKKQFSYTVWPQNCTRCGKLYCTDCLQFKRALNNLAHPDPQGKLYKVCELCYDKGPQTLGATRQQTDDFYFFRNRHKDIQSRIIKGTARHVNNLDFEAECIRLKRGFMENVGKSTVIKTMHEIRCFVKLPDWRRSSRYQEQRFCRKCYNCEKEFGLLNSRSVCSVCGANSCNQCVTDDLIVYMQEDDNQCSGAKLAIIKIVGCPNREPDLCMYLKVCYICRMQIQKKQVAQFHEQKIEAEMDESWRTITDVQKTASKIQQKIDIYLPQYQEMIVSLAETHHTPISNHNRSNIQVLAKSQEDLADNFTQIVIVISGMKKLIPNSKGQTTILRNMTTAYLTYYHENMYNYRDLKKQLEDVTPLEVLNRIQQIVEKNTINSVYLTIKQLVFETIHLQSKHSFPMNIPEEMIQVEQVMVRELRQAVKNDGEIKWEEHEELIDAFIKSRLQKHEVFIRPSRRLLKQHGQRYITVVILERVESILQRIQLEISSKCTEKSFIPSVNQIDKLHQFISDQLIELIQEEEEWGFVGNMTQNSPA